MTLDSSDLQSKSRIPGDLSAIVAVPVLLFLAVVWFAPNFSDTDQARLHPFGGDFLQEWVGGHLILTGRQDLLYDAETYRAEQHDADELGFRWPEQRYFPMVYPPFYYLLCSPLANLPYQTAAVIWLALMTAALIAALLILRSLIGPRWWLWTLCLCYPVLLSLTTGQKGTVLLLIFVATFWLLKHQRPFAAGGIFALIAFKPHLAILFGLVMLWQRQWRFLAGCALTLTVQVGLCVAMGTGVCGDFTTVCLNMGDYVNTGGYHLEQGFSLWSGIQLTLPSASMAKIATLCASVLVLAGVWIVFRERFATGDHRGAIQFSVAIIGTALLAPHFYPYDLTILVFVFAMALARTSHLQNGPGSQAIVLASLAAILLATGPLIWIAMNLGIPAGVLLTSLAMGSLIHSFGSRAPGIFGRSKQPASSCDVAGFPSGH